MSLLLPLGFYMTSPSLITSSVWFPTALLLFSKSLCLTCFSSYIPGTLQNSACADRDAFSIDTCETCVLISVSCLLKCRFLSEVFSGHSSEISVSFRALTLPISQPLLYLLSLALVVQTLYYFTYPAFDFLLTPRKLQ